MTIMCVCREDLGGFTVSVNWPYAKWERGTGRENREREEEREGEAELMKQHKRLKLRPKCKTA